MFRFESGGEETPEITIRILKSKNIYYLDQSIGWLYFVLWSVSFYPQVRFRQHFYLCGGLQRTNLKWQIIQMYSRSLWIFEENQLLDLTLIILVMIWLDSLVLPFIIVSYSGHLLCLHFINRKIQDQPIPFSSMMFSFVFMPSLFRYISIDGHYGLSLHDPWCIYNLFIFHICYLRRLILINAVLTNQTIKRCPFHVE